MPPKKESKPAAGAKAGGKSGGKGAKAAEAKGTRRPETTEMPFDPFFNSFAHPHSQRGEEGRQRHQGAPHSVRKAEQDPGGAGQDQGGPEVPGGGHRLQRGQGDQGRRSGLADSRRNGRTVPGRRLCAAHFDGGQTDLHRSADQDQVRLSHHYGGGKEVVFVFPRRV